MSKARFSALAVFLMMTMSAFVVIPTYNVGAMESDDNEGEDGGAPESIDVVVDMIALDEWTVSITAEMPATSSDEMRQGIAWMCGDMIGTSDDEITEACFNHWIEIVSIEIVQFLRSMHYKRQIEIVLVEIVITLRLYYFNLEIVTNIL